MKSKKELFDIGMGNGHPCGMESTIKAKLPPIGSITRLLIGLKATIGNDYRCTDDPDDDTPGMLVTIGASPDGSWHYQTGDNSYSGGAYGHPAWGLCYLYRRSNCAELARGAVDEIAEAFAQMEDYAANKV
jgi:hypothetical protein